jgi:3-polyprenyl-4-hydroxybenzoate decarboxylase
MKELYRFKQFLTESTVADKDIEKEIKKLEDENPKGFKEEIKKLKVRQAALKLSKGVVKENKDNSYYIDQIKRDLEELNIQEANEYLEELAKSILKLKK